MKELILHPTDLSQWYTIVNEAQAYTNIILEEDVESYLVFLLMRYSQNAHLIESIVALDFLHSTQASAKKQVTLMRDVGDKSLLFCGLFPGMASMRHVQLNYFSGMGQAAYLTVSELEEPACAELYVQLSTQFTTLQHLLQSLRSV